MVSYAARSGLSPIFVDIDPNGGLISLPGTLSAMQMHRPIDVEESVIFF